MVDGQSGMASIGHASHIWKGDALTMIPPLFSQKGRHFLHPGMSIARRIASTAQSRKQERG